MENQKGNPEIVRAGYNTIARTYLQSRTQDSADVKLLEELVTRLPQDAEILDVGCGAGLPITKTLAQFGRVTGIDFSESQIALARENVPNAKFLCEDATALSFPDATFDAIVSYYAIIHIPRELHASLFRNLYRMLKQGGYALLCVGANDLDDDIDENYLGTRMYWSHFDAETNKNLLREAGFEIVWARPIGDASCEGAAHLFVLAHKAN